MPDTPFVCFDRDLPLALRTVADDVARRIRSDNGGHGDEAAGLRQRFWNPATTLDVRFLDSPHLADGVLEIAGQWSEHADIHLRQVTHGAADVRVTFAGSGNWSALGTEARVVPDDEPTMCLSDLVRPSSPHRRRRVVLHEFGHVLGLVHEHQSPAADISWDEEAVYADLAGPPNHWDRATAHMNVLRRYREVTTNHTAFDPLSIMLYQLPATWTRDRRTYSDNTELSPLDRAFVAERYPRP